MTVLNNQMLFREKCYLGRSGDGGTYPPFSSENALSYIINLAFFTARDYYSVIRELPSGKGFADICFVPRAKFADKPAVLIELKWDKSVEGALAQIKSKQYTGALTEHKANLLLVGINYDKKKKAHDCEIERYRE